MHKIIFTGNVGKLDGDKVEVRRTPHEHSVCSFSVAVNPPKGSEDKPTWYTCTFWDKQAEVAAKYAEQGKPILIVGRPSVNEWSDRDGKARFSLEVSVSEFEWIGEPPVAALLRESALLDEREDLRRGVKVDSVI